MKDIQELAEGVMPSEIFTSISHDPETKEICIQYGYVLLSIPEEDYESLVSLLTEAAQQIG
jgi:hypothetical protein